MAKKKSVGKKLKKMKTDLSSMSLSKGAKEIDKLDEEIKKPAVATGQRMLKRMKKEGITEVDRANMIEQIKQMDISPENKKKLLEKWNK